MKAGKVLNVPAAMFRTTAKRRKKGVEGEDVEKGRREREEK